MKKFLISTLSLLFIALPALAWDSVGHRLISAIAYEHLTPQAKLAVDKLSNILDPTYPPFTRFLYISTLPDKWRYDNSNPHFIDIPWSPDNTPLRTHLSPHLISVLQNNEKILVNPLSKDTEKAQALAYVIHLVEDAHQPLHTSNRFTQLYPKGDAGGNKFKLNSNYGNNLHAWWDKSARLLKSSKQYYPLKNKQILKLAQQLQTQYPKNSFGKAAENLSVEDWVTESHQIARKQVYVNIKEGKVPSRTYQKMQRAIAAQQITLAGYRLAALLNTIYQIDVTQ